MILILLAYINIIYIVYKPMYYFLLPHRYRRYKKLYGYFPLGPFKQPAINDVINNSVIQIKSNL